MKQQSIHHLLSAEDRFGRQLAARLDASADSLPHDISERLRVARQQALARLHDVKSAETSPVVLGNSAALTGGGPGSAWWPQLVSLIPLLALIAGLVAIQLLGSDSMIQDLADIDEAILTDDLPPDAYTDPGFAQFLKAKAHLLQQD